MLAENEKYLRVPFLIAGTLLLTAAIAFGLPRQAQQTASTTKTDRWLHIRVVNSDVKAQTVRINVPLELAENVLPAISKERLHNGKIKIEQAHLEDVDVRAIMAAVRDAKDGQYVTVTGADQDVRVAKQGGHLLVHVEDKNSDHKYGKTGHKANSSEVEVKIPMRVVDALLSAGKDELDVVAALHALAAQGDTELVSVKSDDSTVRIWLDTKNTGD
jgi:hypothetical protein